MRPGEVISITLILILLCVASAILAVIGGYYLHLVEGEDRNISEQVGRSMSMADSNRSLAGYDTTEGRDQHPHRAQTLPLNNSKTLPGALLSGGADEIDAVSPVSSILPMNISDLISLPLAQEQTFGAESNPTGSPIGGGDGYHDIFTPTDPRITHTVTTTDEFLVALGSAESGDVIYIDEHAHINLTDTPEGVTIPGGVTLASNRGERKTAGSVVYSFDIAEPGDYTVWGLASAPGEERNSFWISVDGEETREWILENSSDWRWNREGLHHLSGDQHTLTIHWQEGGARLDGILMTNGTSSLPDDAVQEQDGRRSIWIEAESGEISPPMESSLDPTASGGASISSPGGSGMEEFTFSQGGRIFQGPTESNYPVGLIAGGEHVRITGIRLEGPDTTIDALDQPSLGIRSTYRNIEVDNCEISGWSGAAISLYGTGGSDMKTGGYIHHNYIHHCQMNGLGYGVVVSGGGVGLIEANYFDYCRHGIAGTGVAGDGYEARYNICGPNWIATSPQNFDMHGSSTSSGTIAGDTLKIHHNTFMSTNAIPIAIRGVPRDGAYIDHNWFTYTQQAPVWQTGGQGNLFVTDNLIGQDGVLSRSGPIKYY